MRHSRRMKHATNLRPTHLADRRVGKLLAGVPLLAPFLAISLAGAAMAQDPSTDSVIVDVSDPNISVDLSVLDDGGIGPRLGAPLPAATSPTQAPRRDG